MDHDHDAQIARNGVCFTCTRAEVSADLEARDAPLPVALPSASAPDQAPLLGGLSTGRQLGIVWDVTDTIALRPEFTFNRGNSDSTVGSTTTTTTRTQWGGAVSALFYMNKMDNVHTYLAPRFDLHRATVSVGSTDTTAKDYAVSGSFGAQYNLSPRFHVFGEFGLEYSWVPEETVGTAKVKSNNFGTRSAVGVAVLPLDAPVEIELIVAFE